MKLSACRRLARRPISGTWYRAITTKYWFDALSTTHTAEFAGRFSPGKAAIRPFEILYLAETPVVALYEIGAVFGPPEQHIAHHRKTKAVTLDIEVRLQKVADLSDPIQQALLGVSSQELTGNWGMYPPGEAPTQRLGAALYETKNIEGFLSISARMSSHQTLIVFPQKLLKGSELRFEDTITHRTHVRRANSDP
jgi:RES domain-containing protein